MLTFQSFRTYKPRFLEPTFQPCQPSRSAETRS